jgi:ferredoxin
MIVGEQKPLSEIKSIISPYKKVLILGCGTCVKTCFAGGEDEVAVSASSLRLAFRQDGQSIKIEEQTVERQCEDEFVKEAAEPASRNEAVLSLACGAGVQMVANRFAKIPVLPGVNTTFIGILEKRGLFTEKCLGCAIVFETFGGLSGKSLC